MPSLINGKFQLPALDLKFGSLTEGTDIPPPLPSPIEEEKPEAPKPAAEDAAKSSTATNGTSPAVTNANGTKRSAEDVPLPSSPTSIRTGQGSIRRLLSRNRLDSAYANGDTAAGDAGVQALRKPDSRPTSRSNASVTTEKQSKRASGFFRRFRSSHDATDNTRPSRLSTSNENEKPGISSPKSRGPPPPMIPEFKALGSKVDLDGEQGSLGDDLFKNIK
ncbi:hypothetical protein KVR01_002369 [Diaporthe batatas]|uniref:uncharacterized protein n=1 Tax=Diaporthe batatas TaxID=748121 RepID=UPI001D043EF4|nr:uncharacterized protein KVR01_002369 [Diaporthe batatas]KAG8166680.1 hypothetical protein KVR01_002369 [Diaporthe batatas]